MDCINNNIEIIKRQNNFICTFKMAYNNTCNSINTGYFRLFVSFKKESKIIKYTYTKQHKHSNPVPVQLYNYYFLYKVIYNPAIPIIPTNPNSDNGLMYDGLASTITGGNFLEGAAIGLVVTALNHALHEALDPDPKKQKEILQNKFLEELKNQGFKVLFDGTSLTVVDSKGNVVFKELATSGKGVHMNNKESQNIKDQGPIPEGEYSFQGSEWNKLSRLQQAKQLTRSFFNFILEPGGGDWGDYNVRLQNYNGNMFGRDKFYIHGGFLKGSAGCIDLGNNVENFFKITYSMSNIKVIVKYK